MYHRITGCLFMCKKLKTNNRKERRDIGEFWRLFFVHLIRKSNMFKMYLLIKRLFYLYFFYIFLILVNVFKDSIFYII